MLRESNDQDITLDKIGSRHEEITTKSPEDDEAWQVLANCQISLPLTGQLKLVPQFTEKVAHIMARNESEKVSVKFTNPIKGPTIMDEQSPTIKAII